MSTLSLHPRRDPFFAEFDALVRSSLAPASERLALNPAAETVRDGDDVVLRLDLPGVAAEDVELEASNGRLIVSGERRDTRPDEASGGISEVRYGRFRRTFSMPGHLGADAVSASFDRGVLSIRVAGVYAGSEPTRITISEGGSTAIAAGEPPADED